MNSSSSKTIPWGFQVFVVLYALHSTIPFVGFYTPAVVHAAVLVILYGFLLIYNKNWAVPDFANVILIFVINILSIIYFGFKNVAIELYGLLQLLIFPLISLYLIRTGDRIAVKRIVVFISISFLLTSITTYLGCRAYPSASRHLAARLSTNDSALYAFYMSKNIGSFAFIYALVLLLPLLIYVIRNKKINRLIGYLVLVMVSLTIIKSDYTTALLCMLISIIVLFVFPKQLKTRHYSMLTILTIILVLTSSQYISSILNNLSGVFNSEVVSERLQQLSDYSLNEEGYFLEGDLDDRSELYKISLNSFLQSPLTGSSSAKIGGHSFVFDNMGAFGLIGILGMIVMYYTIFKCFFAPFKQQKWFGHILFSFLLAILLAFLNPKENLNILTFYIPLFCVAFNENE